MADHGRTPTGAVMEWNKDTAGWWDLETGDGGYVASFQLLSNLGVRGRGDGGAHWVILWHDTSNEEFLNPDEYTEAEVRNHIVLKYKLLRGERHE